MKRKKVCALLCVAALSTATITPAMAADNTADVQTATESTVVSEEQADVADASQEAQDPAGTEDVETPAQEEQSGVTEQTQDAAVSNEQTTESAPATDEVQNDADGEDEVQKDGWYEDEDGNYYYYEKGEMITEEIVEIEDEDGTYGYWFDSDGVMFKEGETWVNYWDEEEEIWLDGNIRADEYGHLYKGWSGEKYYGDDYFQYYSRILEEGDTLYYFDNYGLLVKDKEVIVDDVLYKADENGALTIVDATGRNGWSQSGDDWYYYKDGKALKDTFEEIEGVQYYFWSDGKMATGRFGIDGVTYWAEPSGQIVKTKGWYHSKQTGKWYWFDKNGELTTEQLLDLNGTKYYVNWDGEMQTGVFEASYEENGNWVYKTLFADASGAINMSSGWKAKNDDWYYVKADGTVAKDEIAEIGGKKYKFSRDGIMETGRIYEWDGEESQYYIADNSGALITNNWAFFDLEWYYTDADGKVLKDQWIGGTYYLRDDGSMAIGATDIDGKTFIFDENGHKKMIMEEQKDGWYLEDGDWYYVKDGKLSTGWIDLGQKYYLADGRMVTNGMVPAEHLKDRYSYVDQDGHIKSGWAHGMNDWMYLEKDKETGDIVAVHEGWKVIGGTRYYFEDDFMAADCIIEIDNRLNKFAASGAWEGYADSKGWKQTSSGIWLYVNDDGTLNTEEKKTINGTTYYFWQYGGMLQNTTYYDKSTGSYYWINNNGNLDASTGWKKNKWNDWYYVENGKIVIGAKEINGAEYYFEYAGRMIENEVREEDGKYYLYDGNGKKNDVPRNGWYSTNNRDGYTSWYYFQNGRPYDGQLGNYYIFYGEMMTGWYGTSQGLYLFDRNGILQKNGWKLVDGIWYYAGTTGRLYTGERRIGGKTYWFNHNGEWIR